MLRLKVGSHQQVSVPWKAETDSTLYKQLEIQCTNMTCVSVSSQIRDRVTNGGRQDCSPLNVCICASAMFLWVCSNSTKGSIRREIIDRLLSLQGAGRQQQQQRVMLMVRTVQYTDPLQEQELDLLTRRTFHGMWSGTRTSDRLHPIDGFTLKLLWRRHISEYRFTIDCSSYSRHRSLKTV